MACIQRELDEMSLPPGEQYFRSSEHINELQQHHQPDPNGTTIHNGCQNRWAPNVPFGGLNGRQNSWIDGLFGCIRPVMSLLGKSNITDLKQDQDGSNWEIAFENITDLHWLGSGAQGTVFSGNLHGHTVAVKKVRDIKETDIKHLRKLDHENIIKFK